MKGTILVVDDSVKPRHLLARELVEAGYVVTEAGDGDEGWALFCDAEPDLVITDLAMPRTDGHDLLRRIRGHSDVPVIVFSAQESQEEAVRALKGGADDFVSSSRVGVSELVGLATSTVAERPADEPDLARRLAGESGCMRRARSRIAGLAPLSHPVVVIGEGGTGRDTVVRALHDFGFSGAGPLVRVDCGVWEPARGLPRGAAVYLDGVERMSAPAQAFWADHLLGAHPQRERQPRIFAAASPHFEALPDSDFDPALRDALARFPIHLEPLRDRPEDVVPIADVIVGRLADALGRAARLSQPARSLLRQAHWRGNVRQLEQLLERAVAFSAAGPLSPDLLAELMADLEENLGTIRRRGRTQERALLLDALERTGGNVSQAAELMGRSRGAVYRLLEKHGVAAAPLRRASR